MTAMAHTTLVRRRHRDVKLIKAYLALVVLVVGTVFVLDVLGF